MTDHTEAARGFGGPANERIVSVRGVLEARHVHIASGAKPRTLPIPGAELLTTSDQFLDLESLPDRVVFLGSGYISFEFAHIARTAGAKVTMLEMLERPLAGFEPRLVDLLVERTLGMGIELRLGTRVDAIEERREGFRVRATSGSEQLAIDADLVVHGAGRVPDLGDLELEKAGVEYDEAGVLVNECMQSVSNPAVYAAGDAAKAGLPLTPVATYQAHIAAGNLLEGNHRRAEHPPIPSVVFTSPPLASVGLLPEEAKRQELNFATHHARTADWHSPRRVGEESPGYTVLVEEGSGRILGAHVLGPHAEELINLFAMAMRCRLSSTDVKELPRVPYRGLRHAAHGLAASVFAGTRRGPRKPEGAQTRLRRARRGETRQHPATDLHGRRDPEARGRTPGALPGRADGPRRWLGPQPDPARRAVRDRDVAVASAARGPRGCHRTRAVA